MAKAGRPSKLTPQVQETIVATIQAGAYDHVAAGAAGIHRATFYRWMRDGDPEGSDPEKQPFRDFCAAVEQAQDRAEVLYLGTIARAAKNGDVRAATWFLSHRYPE